MDWLTTLGFAMGASWVSGIRLYGAVATLGWLHRLGYAKLPGNLEILSADWVVWVATALFVIEFFADKVPWIDSLWDGVHTFIRIPAGAVLAATAFGHFDPKIQVVAFLIGGSLAATSHTTKSTTRLIVNASPEPVSNWTLSFAEDGIAAAQTALALFLPVVAIGVVSLAFITTITLLPKLWRKSRLAKARGRNSKPA